MTMTTEQLAREMYEQLAAIRKARKHPIMLRNFEDDLEAYLEALRLEHADLAVKLDHANRMVEVYSEAFDGQRLRTHNALCESRRLSDDLWETRRELASVQNDREEGHDKLQDATRKLASQTESIRALLRVIKSQQNACDRSQRGMDEGIVICTRLKSELSAQTQKYHLQIMQAEAISDERWGLLDAKQKVIVSQRKRIEELQIAVMNASEHAPNHWFWRFLPRRTSIPKPIPKKTN